MKLVKLFLSLMMVLMITACGTDTPNETPDTPENPSVTEPVVTTPVVTEPEPELPQVPTFDEKVGLVAITVSEPELLSAAGMEMWYNDVEVVIAGESDIAGLVVRVYYYDADGEQLADTFDESLMYIEIECSGLSETYNVVGFYNPLVVTAKAKVISITLTDGTVLENIVEL